MKSGFKRGARVSGRYTGYANGGKVVGYQDGGLVLKRAESLDLREGGERLPYMTLEKKEPKAVESGDNKKRKPPLPGGVRG